MSMADQRRSGDRDNIAANPNTILPLAAHRASRLVRECDDRLRTRHVEDPKAAHAEWVCQLAEHLPGPERELVLSVFRQGRPVNELAELMRVPTESLRRRLRRVINRLTSPEYAFVAARRREWPPSLRAVATAVILEGKSLRAAERELRLSMHVVRTLRQRALAMARGAQETKAMLSREAPEIDREWRSGQLRMRERGL